MPAAVVGGPRAACRDHQADDDEKGNESLFSGIPKKHILEIMADDSGESQGDGEERVDISRGGLSGIAQSDTSMPKRRDEVAMRNGLAREGGSAVS